MPQARVVTERVLLTGRPGCGKTTLIKRIVKQVARPAGGFYTEEIRERGRRVGFRMITLDAQETWISKNPSAWENMGSTFLRWRASALKQFAKPYARGGLS
jgi:nucleoside-triphosphatase THEP1